MENLYSSKRTGGKKFWNRKKKRKEVDRKVNEEGSREWCENGGLCLRKFPDDDNDFRKSGFREA
jgi:hypothetical protein